MWSTSPRRPTSRERISEKGGGGGKRGWLNGVRPLFVQYNAKLTSMQKMERFSIYEEGIGVTLPLCNGLIDDAFTGLQFISISLTGRMTMSNGSAGVGRSERCDQELAFCDTTGCFH